MLGVFAVSCKHSSHQEQMLHQKGIYNGAIVEQMVQASLFFLFAKGALLIFC